MTKTAKPSPLKPRQLRFCELIVGGASATSAYKQAGYVGKGNTAESTASKLLRNPKVQARIAELRKPITKKILMSKDRKREILLEIVTDPKTKQADRMRAIEIDAKLAGDFAPEQHVVETGPNTLESTRERAAAVASALDLNARLRAKGAAAKATGLSRWNPASPP